VTRSAPLDWDAGTYDRVAQPQFEWGLEVLERLSLRGDETVLDAGCGSGRVTAQLLEALPRGRVIAVDASPKMVELARAALPPERASVRQVDLLELSVEEPVDAILSTATFHWIADHERLFGRLFAALAPGGQLVAQCGGAGNIARLHAEIDAVGAREPYAAYFRDWEGPWNYAAPVETERRLRDAGFEEARCWLTPRPARPPDPPAFLATVILRAHLEMLPHELRDRYVADVVAAGGGDELEVDYVRLNIHAIKPGA
jgi:trans-aconitate 2-methyltransferase